MKKILAVLCASLCLCFAVSAYAEEGDTPVAAEAPALTEVVESVGEVGDAVPGEVSEIVSVPEEVIAPAPEEDIAPAPIAPAPQDTVSGEYNLVSEDEIIVNYASSKEELPNLDVLIWVITGVLILACLLIVAYKILQKRRMR